MATSGKCVIPPDVGEAEQTSLDRNVTSRSAERPSDADFDYFVPDRSFLMVLLRALSAPHT